MGSKTLTKEKNEKLLPNIFLRQITDSEMMNLWFSCCQGLSYSYGQCIKKGTCKLSYTLQSFVCNAWNNCYDESDEDPLMCIQWNCPPGYWKCHNGLKCIEERFVCDGDIYGTGHGCNDGSDEDPMMCAQWDCMADYLKCQDGLQCIKDINMCDGSPDCKDGSDDDPPVCFQWNCPAGYWKCQDGLQCMYEMLVCNGRPNCDDESDEDPAMCSSHGTCMVGYMKCAGEVQCRPEHLMCDGKRHCKQSSDEDPVMCAQTKCSDGHWSCRDVLQCIPFSWVCVGNNWPVEGCRDRSDEDPVLCTQWNCNVWLKDSQKCESMDECNYTKCANGLQCVRRESICDDKFDCKDELCDDGCHGQPLRPWEQDIVKKCKEDSHRCLSVKQYCDGIAQCPDASDETRAGCTCEDWGLMSCSIDKHHQRIHCLKVNWAPGDTQNKSVFKCLDFLHITETGNKKGLHHC